MRNLLLWVAIFADGKYAFLQILKYLRGEIIMPLTLKEWIDRAENDRRFMENVTEIKHIPAVAGVYEEFPSWIDKALKDVLVASGIEKL